MASLEKGSSPFYPDQPVPPQSFAGRDAEIRRILEQGVGQAVRGKPVSFYIEGDYGIGKSSIASYIQMLAERDHAMIGLHVALGGVTSLVELSEHILKSALNLDLSQPSRREALGNWLGKYIGKQNLFGFTLNLDALKSELPKTLHPSDLLRFFKDCLEKIDQGKAKGLFLVFDELNGLANQPDFAPFLKSLVDTNARGTPPVPLLLVLCGTAERRGQLITHHPSISRIFDIVTIDRLSDAEVTEFFKRSFESVNMSVSEAALDHMVYASAGIPKVMQLVGNCVFWTAKGTKVSDQDAFDGIVAAAADFGKRFVERQVLDLVQSRDYRTILDKLTRQLGPGNLAFVKKELEANLTASERRKLSNFLQKMKKLNVIASGPVRGEYVFQIRMVQTYLWLRAKHGPA